MNQLNPVNQINPFGVSTIFQDNNFNVITGTGSNVNDDSQFLFHTVTDSLTVVSASVYRGI